MQLHRPRQWGACWLACALYEQLGLDEFWSRRLPDSREGTRWRDISSDQTLVCYRLIASGGCTGEQSAMGDLLGADYALVEKNPRELVTFRRKIGGLDRSGFAAGRE